MSEDSARAKMAEMLKAARAGDAAVEWLDTAVRAAGYGDPPGDKVVVDIRRLMSALSLSRRQIQEYVTLGMPRLVEGKGRRTSRFDVWAVMGWLRDFWKGNGALTGMDAVDYERRKRECDLKTREAESEIKVRQAALEAGRLVERDTVASQFRLILRKVQTSLEGLPAKVSAIVPPGMANEVHANVRECVKNDFNLAVSEIRRMLPEKAGQ